MLEGGFQNAAIGNRNQGVNQSADAYRNSVTCLQNTAANKPVASSQQYQSDMTVAINQQAGAQIAGVNAGAGKQSVVISEALRKPAMVLMKITEWSLVRTNESIYPKSTRQDRYVVQDLKRRNFVRPQPWLRRSVRDFARGWTGNAYTVLTRTANLQDSITWR